MPPIRVRLPKVSRTSDDTSAMPTQDSSKPSAPPASPLSRLPPDNAAISDRPNTDNQKYSTGPNASATDDNGGARNNNDKPPTSPPNTLA